MSLLALDKLSVTFHGGASSVEAVKNVSLNIRKGEFFALVGESGSGKSVSAQAIMRLLPDSAQIDGRILFDGEDITSMKEKALLGLRGKRIAMIFQEPMSALNPLHTIGRQIEEMIRLHQPELKGEARKDHLHELLDQVGLSKFKDRLDAFPHQLSGGERQRVMIAMAMANAPDLLIADEPTTALDVTLQAQILGLLKKLQQERNMSVLLITHDLTIVQNLADRVGVMQQGKLVEQGDVQTLFASPKEAYTKQLIEAIPKGRALPLPDNARQVLSCEALSVFYQQKTSFFTSGKHAVCAVDNASIQLHEGETLGIVGESGSGKTTLALSLLRLIPSQGPIVFLGGRIDQAKGAALRKLRSDLQIVFQDPYASLNPRLNILDIITEGLMVHHAHLSKSERLERANTILGSVGLEHAMLYRYPHEFSGGQRQRISIARAMILAPKVVVLDEPTSALDVSVQAQILELLKRFQTGQNIAYLFITHDLRVIRAISHRVAVMRAGEIIEHSPTDALFESPAHDYTKKLMETAFHTSV